MAQCIGSVGESVAQWDNKDPRHMIASVAQCIGSVGESVA